MLFPREEPAGYPAAVAVPETRARAARGTRDITSDAFRTTDRQFPATRIADGQPPRPATSPIFFLSTLFPFVTRERRFPIRDVCPPVSRAPKITNKTTNAR